MAAVPTSLAGSSGFSEAQMCDNGTEAQEVTTNAQRFCSLRPFSHIPVLDSEQRFHPNALGNRRVWRSHPNGTRFLPCRRSGPELRPLRSATLDIVTFLEEGPVGGQDPQTVGGPVPWEAQKCQRPGQGRREGERSCSQGRLRRTRRSAGQ